ncbi:hypothetical protein GCM10022419_116110 [Nonomuraea rosea]|uniref:Uncharacterized protein n=1 Tax=Nonomuraea rosea TaxID=638574 RepID=A0ABP6ZKS1_9ACTN
MSASPGPEADGPRKGVLVVDLSRALARPHATMMPGDLGTRAATIDAPGPGDDTRGWGPPYGADEGEREPMYFLSADRNQDGQSVRRRAGAETP